MVTTVTTPADSKVGNPFAVLNKSTTTAEADPNTASADRFLTMLVTQLKNQDPLNPMDNAQITSQMAQINTVTGLEKVNESIQSLGSRMLQSQALQGAAVVGRDVSFEGDRVTVRAGMGRGAVERAGSSTSTRVEVLDGAQRVVGILDLGPRDAGRHNFEWPLGSKPQSAAYTFRLVASEGKSAVPGRTLVVDRVQSVSTNGDGLTFTTSRNGVLPASQVVAYN
jgi:flagellar basal-body rod modification protein FlgD